jgi:hypothetical protein
LRGLSGRGGRNFEYLCTVVRRRVLVVSKAERVVCKVSLGLFYTKSLYTVAAFIDFVAKLPGQLFKLPPEVHLGHDGRTRTLLHRERDVRGRSKNDSRILSSTVKMAQMHRLHKHGARADPKLRQHKHRHRASA